MQPNTNLLAETLQALDDAGKTPADVAWVGSHDGRISGTWDDFAKIAHHVNYDSGFGTAEIPSELVVVLTDQTWLERDEYDGSEGWLHKKSPTREDEPFPLTIDLVRDRGW